MIEDMYDDDLGFVSARRIYACAVEGDVVFRHMPFDDGGRVREAMVSSTSTEEMSCGICLRGPLLWDRFRHWAYVLVPYVITEEPW